MDLFGSGLMLLMALGLGFIGGQALTKEPDLETMKDRIVAHRVREKMSNAVRAKLDEEIETESDARVARHQ